MITLNHVEFKYSNSGFGMRVPSLTIEAGSKAALVGPSGSGKTTLLHIIAGIRVPEQGEVEVCGVDLASSADAARRDFRISTIGFVFQDFELIDYLDVNENILLPYLINNSLKFDSTVREAARSLAESMGLGNKLTRRIDRLSHGERQRVAICRALLLSPRILLADEPTGNLDPKNKERILRILFDCATNANAALLVVTHDYNLLGGFDQVVDCQQFQVGD
ncbi:MAG: ABC transporter ATP-binding protein [Candidatus Zixiibacteriota bacterium]|nr:MAG: ABC transporter ATP-binding protein [candidate division Zixibacteria bacterium]